MSMDKTAGGDCYRGLVALKVVAEAAAKPGALGANRAVTQ